jgi:hypothetical protein
MRRRRFLQAALGACGALALSLDARSASARSKIAEIQPSRLGTTFRLALDHAPFPHAGAAYTDPTVHVFVPRSYRAPGNGALDVVVYFHGHNTTAQRAMMAHALREQLVDSKQNAILIVPQGAVLAPESGLGKLATSGGLRRMLAETATVLRSGEAADALGAASTPADPKIGIVCLAGHSGGYTSVATCLARGGVSVREVYLFDALYGEVAAFRDWVLAGKDPPRERTPDRNVRTRHKLVSYYVGERVRSNSLELLAGLEAAGIACLHELTPGELSRTQMTRGRAIFLRSRLTHGGVPYELNGLRDCLFASCLPRRLQTDWFDHSSDARPLERRSVAPRTQCAKRCGN